MKATLLIKNIAALYTCDAQSHVFHDAFLAVHHDKIMDLGIHDYHSYIDDATRVVDARGECVVPAFIEPALKLDTAPGINTLYLDNAVLHAMYTNGILTCVSSNPWMQRQHIDQEVVVRTLIPQVPVIASIQDFHALTGAQTYILSCGYKKDEHPVYTMHTLAAMLHALEGVDASDLLQAMTARSACAMHLGKKGILAPGWQADLLVLRCRDFDTYLKTEGISLIHRMVKRGIPVYPYWIRA